MYIYINKFQVTLQMWRINHKKKILYLKALKNEINQIILMESF